jgi:ATP-binding cassette subfamily B protein
MSRMTTDLFDITELTHHCPEDIFISAVTIIGAFIVLFNINWILSLCLIALAPLALLATMAQRSKMAKASRKVKESMATINAAVESGVSGARVAKAFVNEQHEVEKMESGNTLLKIARMTYYRTMAMFQSQIEFFASFFSVFVIIIGGVLLINDMISIVDLLVFSLYIGTFIQPIRKLTSLTVEQIANGLAGFDRFLEIMRIKPDITDSPTAKPIENVKGEVEYRNISFAYNSQTQVLKNVNLKIAPGKTVAIVGPSGGGKSTLCHLLPRFYEITEGEILLDGKNIKDITIESLRKNIGIVSQEVFLFAGTIKDNIEYGRIGATDEEIVAAAKKAKIYDMIAELPDGLETQVGERGVRLSGGQKQRISIARIFLKNPPVLILDEATSALDTVTEKQIQASFAELSVGRTTMIIAHRLSTIVGADEIIYIDEQGIREQGTHEQLLAKCGFYAKLFKMQFEETTV